MPVVAAAPPQRLPAPAGTAAIAIDARRRRVYLARPRAGSVLIVGADDRHLHGRLAVDGALAVAVEPLGGALFVGTTDGRLLEVDPSAPRIVRALALAGPIQRLAYDAVLGRLYATAADSATLWIVDVPSFGLAATITLPGSRLGGLAVDPLTHDVYVDLAGQGQVAVVEPNDERPAETYVTPGVSDAPVLLLDAPLGELIVVGSAGQALALDRDGYALSRFALAAGVSDCALGGQGADLVCASPGALGVTALGNAGAAQPQGSTPLAGGDARLAGGDDGKQVWAVWAGPQAADLLQPFTLPGAR